MGYANPAAQPPDAETRVLSGVHKLCIAAQGFYALAARQVDDSNLRYHFLQLSALHSHAACKLPSTKNSAVAAEFNKELVSVHCWYQQQQAVLHDQPPPKYMLAELASLLQQQLNALKYLSKCLQSHSARASLANLSATLQMASDQLLPLLKVLPTSRQKIQT